MRKMRFLPVASLLILVLIVGGVASVTAQSTTKSLSTNYTVQNLSSELATIEVKYLRSYDGTTPGGTWPAAAANRNFNIQGGSSKVIAQYFDNTMPDGAGSAIVESNVAIAAIVNQLARDQTPTSGSYTAFSEGSESFFMPFAFKNLTTSVGVINSQLIIQNVGQTPIDVQVRLINGDTGNVDHTKNINDLPVGESFYYDQSTETKLPASWYGSAEVSAPGGLIAAVGNQFTGSHGLLTYPGFPEGYTDWVVPLYLSRLNNGYNSVIVIQNVSGGTLPKGSIKVTFTPNPSVGGSPFFIPNPTAVANTATWVVNPRGNADFPVDSYGAARIESPSGDVVAIVNQLVNEPPNSSPSALSYNAIRADLQGTYVKAPLIMSRLANGYSTVFTVANLTATAGKCTFTYKPDPSLGLSDTVVSNVTLPASGSIVHNHRLDGATTHKLPTEWYGAATVACDRRVAGVVNQLQSGAPGDPDLSYNAFTTTTP